MTVTYPPLNIYIQLPILVHALLAYLPKAAHNLTLNLEAVNDHKAISTLLNVLPPSTSPDLFHILVTRLPWIDSDAACKLGNLALLDFLHTRLRGKRPIQFTYPHALVLAAQGGHVQVFDWWAANVGPPVLTDKARMHVVEAASRGGHAQVVARYAPRVDSDGSNVAECAASVRAASAGGHVQVLSVWRDLGLLDWVAEVMDGSVLATAVVAGQLDVVQWWFELSLVIAGGPIPDLEARTALGVAAITGDRAALDLLLGMFGKLFDAQIAGLSCATGDLDWIQLCQAKAGGQLSPETAVTVSLVLGHVHLLDWLLLKLDSPSELANATCASEWTLLENAVPLLLSSAHAQGRYQPLQRLIESGRGAGRVSPYTAACIGGHVESLDWLQSHEIPLKQVLDQRLVDIATGYGYVHVLEWIRVHLAYFISSLVPSTLNRYLQWATDQGHVHVLDWWTAHLGHRIVPNDSAPVRFVEALRLGHVQVLEWWQHKAPYPTVVFSNNDISSAVHSDLETDLGVHWWIRHNKDMDVRNVLRGLSMNSRMALVDEVIARHGVPPSSILCCLASTFPRAWDWLAWALRPSNAVHLAQGCAFPRTNAVSMLASGNALFLDACWHAGWIQEPFHLELHSGRGNEDQDGSVAVWEWAMSTGMRLRYMPDSLYEVSKAGKVHLLEWFTGRRARFEALVMPKSIMDLERRCNPSGVTPLSARVLKWWRGYGLPEVDPIA